MVSIVPADKVKHTSHGLIECIKPCRSSPDKTLSRTHKQLSCQAGNMQYLVDITELEEIER